jgi:type II restriction enzyme
MNLQCRAELASAYKSGSQVARVLTEEWCAREVYCPACTSDRLSPSKVNAPAIDFVCPECRQLFQLKSIRNWNPKKIVDAGYESMLRSIRADRVPNLLVLQYSADWFVRNLLLVPRFFFSESAIEKRKPSSPGWLGRLQHSPASNTDRRKDRYGFGRAVAAAGPSPRRVRTHT